MFGDESDSDSCTKGGDRIQENASDIYKKDTGATKLEGWGNFFSVEEGSFKCGVFLVLNKKGGTKCAASETEKLGLEVKLYVSIVADIGAGLRSSRTWAGGFKFGGLGLQGQTDGYSVRNIFECSCTENGMGA